MDKFFFSFFFFFLFNGVVIFDAWDLNKIFFHLGSQLLSVYRLGRYFQVCIICENLSCVLNCIRFFCELDSGL